MNTGDLEQSFQAIIRGIGNARPLCVAVLGSGWSQAVANLHTAARLPYSGVPLLSTPPVAGHEGHLVLVRQEGVDALVFCGRKHWYEGYGWEPVALPVFVAARIGAPYLLLTNAAGGVHAELAPGWAMLVTDHINLMGASPLVGQHDPVWGARFPDMTRVYDEQTGTLLAECLLETGMKFRHGVYAAVSGPSYETPAEVRALRLLGADAVGMSTVPEAILGKAAGLRVAAVSMIANRAAGLTQGATLDHGEVLRTAGCSIAAAGKALSLFLARLPGLAAPGSP
jgi:purine-nucleoside phosphorylase